MIHKIHPALSQFTESKFVALLEKSPVAVFDRLFDIVHIGEFSISLLVDSDYEETRFYDEHHNNFATIRFTYFGDIYCFVYKFGTMPATKEQLFDSLSSMSDGFIEWILWNQIL